MLTNTWVGSYWVGADGKWIPNYDPDLNATWIQVGNTWYYQRTDGSRLTNTWKMINGSWYYFTNSGAMLTGWNVIGGTWYYLDGNGAMRTGWINDGKKYYYLKSNGAWKNITIAVVGNNNADAATCAAKVREMGADSVVVTGAFNAAQYDGMILPGGGDIDPARYGQANTASKNIDNALDDRQISAVKQCDQNGKPVLGICKGMQLINVVYGGTLNQDMRNHMGVWHATNVIANGWFSSIYLGAVNTLSCVYVDPYLDSTQKQKVEGIIAEGLRAAVSRNAVICEGEKSTGKNVYLETISWLMGMPMYLITFSRQMSPSSIYGEKTTDNSAAKALSEFDQNILAKAEVIREKMRFAASMLSGKSCNLEQAIEKALPAEDRKILEQAKQFEILRAKAASVNITIDASELYDWLIDGGLLCFNEMNMAEANFFASFTNQLLDGTGFLFIPGRGEVSIHKDCVLFGTQNADYEGVEQQNEATMSRFGCIEFRQPETIKGQLVAAVDSRLKKDGFTGVSLSAKHYKEAEAFYKQCRGAVRKAQVSNAVLNIRGFVRALVTVAESDGYATYLFGSVCYQIGLKN